ncbi:hypothetical protein [Oscillibacter ruminantium]|uniref:hypothetical protein n=1 Tax=Oscillibacter ruminantium TaxID=1263547 RepID=UPI00331E9965
MDIKIKPGDLQGAVENILREYGDQVYVATDEGLAAAEKVLIENLKAATPVINPTKMPKGYKDKHFRKSWKGTGKKYKLLRFVGNSATVFSKKHDSISLANIFEYSKKGHPFIKNTFENSIPAMAAAVVSEIKKGAQ